MLDGLETEAAADTAAHDMELRKTEVIHQCEVVACISRIPVSQIDGAEFSFGTRYGRVLVRSLIVRTIL